MPRRVAIPVVLLILSLVVVVPASAQREPPTGRAAPPIARFALARATSAVKVDGVLDEGAWTSATVVPLPYEWAPADGVAPPVKTDCLVAFDHANLYVAFRAYDPEPGRIRAHLMDRDDTDTLIQLDFANNRRATRVIQVSPQIDYRPISRMSVAFSYNLDELSVYGGRLYRAHLAQVRALYHLNPRMYLRGIVQYTDIRREPALYTFPVASRSRRLFSQYLFSYKLNPQTVLFAGYADNALSGQTIDLRKENRTFFIKAGYAWVL